MTMADEAAEPRSSLDNLSDHDLAKYAAIASGRAEAQVEKIEKKLDRNLGQIFEKLEALAQTQAKSGTIDSKYLVGTIISVLMLLGTFGSAILLGGGMFFRSMTKPMEMTMMHQQEALSEMRRADEERHFGHAGIEGHPAAIKALTSLTLRVLHLEQDQEHLAGSMSKLESRTANNKRQSAAIYSLHQRLHNLEHPEEPMEDDLFLPGDGH